jgi:hypothetical protein
VEVYLQQDIDSKPKILIICTINGKKINKVKITYTSKLLRINAIV